MDRRFALALILLTALLSMPVFVGDRSCRAAEVWSDDFDDGDYDGWSTLGNFSAADRSLRAGHSPDTPMGVSVACRPSQVATGTWSFDVYITDVPAIPGSFEVIFIADDPDCPYDPGAVEEVYAYTLYIYPHIQTLFGLKRAAGAYPATSVRIAEYRAAEHLSGWHHIDITRDTDGRFCLYLNGELVMDVVDTTIMSSRNFHFLAPEGPALDNVVVRDTVEPPLFRVVTLTSVTFETVTETATSTSLTTAVSRETVSKTETAYKESTQYETYTTSMRYTATEVATTTVVEGVGVDNVALSALAFVVGLAVGAAVIIVVRRRRTPSISKG